MNEWSTKTLRLVMEKNYLDKLQFVYPHEDGTREVDKDTINSIQNAYHQNDRKILLNRLLDLEKFPYKDSYIGFLRIDRSAIERNPQTTNRICDRLYGMGIEQIISGIAQPKEANTRRGNQFTDWTKETFRALSTTDFRNSNRGIAILDASEAEAINFCKTEIEMGISKRPDLVAKAGRHYVVGEAKFLSSTGGNQGRAFDDGMTLATNVSGRAYKVFILDGVHWIVRGSEEFNRIEHSNATIFSVLLLEEYLQQISNA